MLFAIDFLWLVTFIAGLDVSVHLSLDMSSDFSHVPNLRTQLQLIKTGLVGRIPSTNISSAHTKMKRKINSNKMSKSQLLTGSEYRRPTIPVAIVLQEAEDLYDWCKHDKEALLNVGLNWELVEEIPVRTDALRKSQAKWVCEYKIVQTYNSKWGEAIRAAFNLRDELAHHFHYAFDKQKKVLSQVQRISKGNSNADMIQNLSDLSEFGFKHKTRLKEVGIDLNLLSEARDKSFEFANLLSEVNNEGKESSPSREARDKAYSQLKEVVKEIRRVGKYVFWKDDFRRRGYVSNYIRRVNKVRKIRVNELKKSI
jgi:hypothetical protein